MKKRASFIQKGFSKQYFIVDIFSNERKRFYANNDEDAYQFACKNFESDSPVYLNAGGGVFLGFTR